MKIDELREAGDEDRGKVWKRIADAIAKLDDMEASAKVYYRLLSTAYDLQLIPDGRDLISKTYVPSLASILEVNHDNHRMVSAGTHQWLYRK